MNISEQLSHILARNAVIIIFLPPEPAAVYFMHGSENYGNTKAFKLLNKKRVQIKLVVKIGVKIRTVRIYLRKFFF